VLRIHGMRIQQQNWVRALTSEWFDQLADAEQWYERHIQWRGYDNVHVELPNGVVYPALSFETIRRIVARLHSTEER